MHNVRQSHVCFYFSDYLKEQVALKDTLFDDNQWSCPVTTTSSVHASVRDRHSQTVSLKVAHCPKNTTTFHNFRDSVATWTVNKFGRSDLPPVEDSFDAQTVSTLLNDSN